MFLLIDKKSGEICEMIIKTLGEKTFRLDNQDYFEIGEVAIIGNVTNDGEQSICEKFEILN